MIETLCKQYTELRHSDIEKIKNIASMIPYFCELSNADIFIDCFMNDGKKGIVVFHGKAGLNSLYENNIQGEIVLPQNEPIVFFTLKTGKAIRDAKGLSQEKKWVLQRTVPIYNDEKRIIGVLVEERNMTDNIKTINKLEQMENVTRDMVNRGSSFQNFSDEEDKLMIVQEMHHRIKNNLQIISSILSMQERRSRTDEVKKALKDKIYRIKSIAQIHEMLMTADEKKMNIIEQLQILAGNMAAYASSEEKKIKINLTGSPLYINSEKALSVLMAVNELITNSIRHGYAENESGNINITVVKGTIFSTIIVEDDGKGYKLKNEKQCAGGLGNEIISMMVHDKLKGSLCIDSGDKGTCVTFDFKMDTN